MRSMLLVWWTLLAAGGAQADLQCLDDTGRAVDWWVAYKLPRTAGAPFVDPLANLALNTGEAYAFASSASSTLRVSSLHASEKSSAFGRTLAPLYRSTPAAVGYLAYNDQADDGSSCSSNRAHAKGVFMWDDASGTAVWLVHSVPRFPPNPDFSDYSYPSTGQLYGQTLMCVAGALPPNEVFTQLQHTKPCFYSSKYSATHLAVYPMLNTLLGASYVPNVVPARTLELETAGGARLTHFAKTRFLGADLYDAYVRSALDSSVAVATWIGPPSPNLESTCDTRRKVFNVNAMRVVGVDFVTSKDHSKWAVTTDAGANSGNNIWTSSSSSSVCICDINRQLSQFTRGGGCLCLRSQPALWRQFINIAADFEDCGGFAGAARRESAADAPESPLAAA